MHHSVQEEWIFNTKQLELAKFYYKHLYVVIIQIQMRNICYQIIPDMLTYICIVNNV